MEHLRLFILVAAVPWCIAVLVKVARAWTRPEAPYAFAYWDGGALFRGRTVGRTGASLQGLLALGLLALSIYRLTGR